MTNRWKSIRRPRTSKGCLYFRTLYLVRVTCGRSVYFRTLYLVRVTCGRSVYFRTLYLVRVTCAGRWSFVLPVTTISSTNITGRHNISNLPNKLSVYSAPSTSWNKSPFAPGTIPWCFLQMWHLYTFIIIIILMRIYTIYSNWIIKHLFTLIIYNYYIYMYI
jgi:hypothetical protein